MMAGLPVLAHAHPAGEAVHGLFTGISHPVFGLDHLAAMIAVGLWSAQLGGRAIWLAPLTFVAVMTLGGLLGMAGITFAYAETGILLSLLVLGVLIAAAIRLPTLLSVAMVGAFAFCHGHAHGAELPTEATALTYVVGFVLATTALHLTGIATARYAQHKGGADWLRLAGMAIALSGLSLAV